MIDVAIKRIDYSDIELRQLYKMKCPVIIENMAMQAELKLFNKQFVLDVMRDYLFSGVRLKNSKPDIFESKSSPFESVLGEKLQTDSALWEKFYFVEPFEYLPNEIKDNFYFPFDCNRELYCKSRIWLAELGTRTPLHRDIPHTFIFVHEGVKNANLLKRSALKFRDSYSPFSSAPNFSRLDLRKLEEKNSNTYLQKLQCYKGVITKGEALYIPPLWWHDLENESFVVSTHFWFTPFGFWRVMASLSNLFKKLAGVYKGEWK